jgi:hypothetical protein
LIASLPFAWFIGQTTPFFDSWAALTSRRISSDERPIGKLLIISTSTVPSGLMMNRPRNEMPAPSASTP